MAELRVWRRKHAPDLVAEVRPVEGMGLWDVVAYQEGAPEVIPGGRFELLTNAQHAADNLTAIAFRHTCRDKCGDWGAFNQPRKRKT